MGKRSQILLVAAAIAACLSACAERPDDSPENVVAADYDSFFLWAGVEPDDALASAETVYILSGEVRCDNPIHFESLRAPPRLGEEVSVWLVVRADCLDWDPQIEQRVLSDLERWSRSNNLVGLQIDYDSPTGELANYAKFMRELRDRLPDNYKLSATGLMDWSARGDPEALAQLGEAIDEVVVQTYRGRTTITNYQRYSDSLADLPLNYRVALVENGEWDPPAELEDDREFLGYVVFLLNN